jgi:hypothetical protein
MNDDLAFALERSFLASEFLTWMWFRCEVEGGTFDLPSGGLSVAVEDSLALVSWEDDGVKASLKGGTPTRRPEAANALASGLLLRKARFVAARAGTEWLFALDAEHLDLRSVKVVESDPDEDPEDALVDKLFAGEELRLAIDELYADFLALRLDSEWELETTRLRDWVRQKVEHAASAVGAV